MTKEQLQQFEWMWTTNADEFFLVRFSDGTYIIYRQTAVSGGPFTFENDELYAAIKEEMLKAGIKIIEMSEMIRRRRDSQTFQK
jgi:hypothetical protein